MNESELLQQLLGSILPKQHEKWEEAGVLLKSSYAMLPRDFVDSLPDEYEVKLSLSLSHWGLFLSALQKEGKFLACTRGEDFAPAAYWSQLAEAAALMRYPTMVPYLSGKAGGLVEVGEHEQQHSIASVVAIGVAPPEDWEDDIREALMASTRILFSISPVYKEAFDRDGEPGLTKAILSHPPEEVDLHTYLQMPLWSRFEAFFGAMIRSDFKTTHPALYWNVVCGNVHIIRAVPGAILPMTEAVPWWRGANGPSGA
jgi:hypothetical protein